MTTTNTIKFNVGGRPFEVSRDLMEKHSETMLGKLVSEAWQADPEDEPVFIDRDGDIFAHVLCPCPQLSALWEVRVIHVSLPFCIITSC